LSRNFPFSCHTKLIFRGSSQGYSLPLIGRALNHTNVSTTQIYARLDLDPVRNAREKTATPMFGDISGDPEGAKH
jgi:hypothetical protein